MSEGVKGERMGEYTWQPQQPMQTLRSSFLGNSKRVGFDFLLDNHHKTATINCMKNYFTSNDKGSTYLHK